MKPRNALRPLALCSLAGLLTAAAAPAFAGLANVGTVLTGITTMLTSASVAVVTLATLWVGYKTLWAGAQWQDVSKVVIGAVIIGGASAIAALLTS